MEQKQIDLVLDQVRAALEHNNMTAAIAALETLHPADRADAFADLPPDDQSDIFSRLDTEAAADLLDEMGDEEAAAVAAQLPTGQLADLLDEMDPDEAADLLGDLSPRQAADALAQMEDRDEVLPLLGHPDDTAGGLMTSEFIALRRQTTAQMAIDFLRGLQRDAQTPYYLYVVDRGGVLIGVVGLRDIIIASPQAAMAEIMRTEVTSVPVGTDQEEVARLMQRYDLLALPVVDAERRLVGVINYDDIVDVIEEEATEDLLRFGGVEAGVDVGRPYFAAPLLRVIRKRIGWLLLLFVAETFTGTVLRLFEHELATVVALSFFIPLLIGTGGNTGAQTVSTLIRGLALGDVRARDIWRVIARELLSGLVLGSILGVVAFGRALVWQTGYPLATVVGLSVVAICTWANVMGALIPLAAHRLKIDPAVVSAPLITTLVDATGLAIYFLIAKAILGL